MTHAIRCEIMRRLIILGTYTYYSMGPRRYLDVIFRGKIF